MSGGSMNYLCYRVEEVADDFEDREIRDLVKDVATLLHDKEWYDSGDYGPDSYQKCVDTFKKKWFGDTRNDRLKDYINTALDDMKAEIEKLV